MPLGGFLFTPSIRMSVHRRSHAAADSTASKPLQKGQQTKAAIVDAALGLATQIGLEAVSYTHLTLPTICSV